ncbi:MAG TPA: hypothetical protein VGW10_06820, partial [Solirubrobacteraceae bacterium]|nr:hypothetical protein [Solirubrobacteraceae bacterium]
LEARAREANGAAATPGRTAARRGRAPLHPDQEAAVASIAETLGGAFGKEVRVRPAGTGYRVELELSTMEEAAALAGRLSHGPGATLPTPEGD